MGWCWNLFLPGSQMKPNQFLTRVAIIIIGVGGFNILCMELLITFIMAPTLKEFVTILSSPLPVAIPLLSTHVIISMLYLRPVRQFLAEIAEGVLPSPELIKTATNRTINLAYFLALLSFPAYVLGGILGYGLMVKALPGWPAYVVIYGGLAGIIAGLLTVPMSEHFSAWAVRPVLDTIISIDTGRQHSRSAGFSMPLRRKFVLIIVVMVVAITGYTMIISYSLINSVVHNMEQMESLLPADTAQTLARDSFGTTDHRIKSSSYYKSQRGSINFFLIAVMTIGTLLSLLVGLAAANAITWPLHRFETVAEKIQSGQYNEKINIIANDEFAELAASVNRMTETLLSQLEQNRALIDSIGDALETLSPMSSQLVAIADQQAGASEHEESAAEDAATTARTIANVGRRIAENTARITRNSERTREITLEGQQRLRQAETTLAAISARMKDIVRVMSLLERQSQEIDEIVQTIKQISGKTNILSINAGIEAIKAGDKGVRFGVVAREIRLLAQDSRQSAEHITSNIERIRASLETALIHVEQGEHTVAAGKEAMTETTEHFNKILYANLNAIRELEQIENITFRQVETNRQLSDTINLIKKGTKETTTATGKTRSILKSLEHLVNQLQTHTQQSS